jgi:hypothetical protein
MPRQPTLAELTQRFLARPVIADDAGTVELYDVVSAFRVDPRDAWRETLVVLKLAGVQSSPPAMPSDWPAHVREQKPATFLPMAFGHYPQQVSDLAALLERRPFSSKRSATPPIAVDSEPLRINEAALKHWYDGQIDEAISHWRRLPDSPVKAFNLGVADLMSGRIESAKEQLAQAIRQLPDESGWKALAELYLGLCMSENEGLLTD